MIKSALGQNDIHGVADDVMVQKDILHYELSAQMRAMDRAITENTRLKNKIEQLEEQLERMQALLDAHALQLEK